MFAAVLSLVCDQMQSIPDAISFKFIHAVYNRMTAKTPHPPPNPDATVATLT